MATVSGPAVARHPSPTFRKPAKVASSRPAPTTHSPHPDTLSRLPPSQPDPYYGHEETAKLCARFVTHLFACPDLPPLSTTRPPAPSPPLALFIAYALHRTRLHTSVHFAALYLLQRLKARFPAARGSSGHRLFISAFMIASKVICDDTYSNKSWSIVGQGMFALREINQMEREMCSYLEWQLNIEPNALKEFELKVRRDFKGPGPYPTYSLPSPAPSPMPSTSPYAAAGSSASASTPSFATRVSSSPPKPVVSTPVSNHSVAYPSPPHTPGELDTPEPSYSTSTSPASSASPPTPPGYVDNSARIVSTSTMGTPGALERDSVPVSSLARKHSTASAVSSVNYGRPIPTSANSSSSIKKSSKMSGDHYARAMPCKW
ncbi:uncharacterized protein LAESUDRAFT_656039 [Laetiporus sulphureus 93-53]|uniref:Cyclin N-terminal domain-containing protein n=1 Tax=Laetiporus sulphureus 93-53 TaxID=1314785 RepID=A0A165DPT7_9APHY|nr:uncharacterized protein LAESUDRAFT_656039 [Laetiporus sulphureus 93-53]KZT05363.1 hypothetical protein LAESUDRAFT_656039 [Laetiporus sulphureus 93-53]